MAGECQRRYQDYAFRTSQKIVISPPEEQPAFTYADLFIYGFDAFFVGGLIWRLFFS